MKPYGLGRHPRLFVVTLLSMLAPGLLMAANAAGRGFCTPAVRNGPVLCLDGFARLGWFAARPESSVAWDPHALEGDPPANASDPRLLAGERRVEDWKTSLGPSAHGRFAGVMTSRFPVIEDGPGRFFCKAMYYELAVAVEWPAAMLLAVQAWCAFALLAEVRRERRFNSGRCVGCGYDLRGIASSRCPECGAGAERSFPPVALTEAGIAPTRPRSRR